MSHFKLLCLLVGISALTFGLGCGALDQAVDCNQICNRYKSCFDAQYNTDACQTRCRDQSKVDTDYRRKADTCNACITDQSCTSATFSCAGPCSSVVP